MKPGKLLTSVLSTKHPAKAIIIWWLRDTLPLPIAGLLLPEPLKLVVEKFEEVGKAAPAPFTLLSFVALSVIPELRLSDMGLVDVLAFKLIE
jgi:adenine deaminase